MASLFGFSKPCTIDIELAPDEGRKKITVSHDNKSETVLLYAVEDVIAGRATITVPPGKKVEHVGVRLELLGLIDLLYDRGNTYEFTAVVKELEGPGEFR